MQPEDSACIMSVFLLLWAFVAYSSLGISLPFARLWLPSRSSLLSLLPLISDFLWFLNVSLLFNFYHWWYLSRLGSPAWVESCGLSGCHLGDERTVQDPTHSCSPHFGTILATHEYITCPTAVSAVCRHIFSMSLFIVLCSLLWPPALRPLSMVGQVVHCRRVPGQRIPDYIPLMEWGATAQGYVYLEGQADGGYACSSPDSECWI